jgi:hypothetical protein
MIEPEAGRPPARSSNLGNEALRSPANSTKISSEIVEHPEGETLDNYEGK